jgi:hypothetical protein
MMETMLRWPQSPTCECNDASQRIPNELDIRYLIETLNLHPANVNNVPSNVTLHDLENALSLLVASMFWTSRFKL